MAFHLFYSHGKGSVSGVEQADDGVEVDPHRSLGLPLAALKVSHQGVHGVVGSGGAVGAGGLLQGGTLLLGSLRGHLGSVRLRSVGVLHLLCSGSCF